MRPQRGPLPFRDDEYGDEFGHEDRPDDPVRDLANVCQPSDFASASMIRMGISESVAASTTGSNGV